MKIIFQKLPTQIFQFLNYNEENKNEILLNKINENEYLKKTAILKYQNKYT